jgi:type IV pilus assembly protein PilW
MAGLRLAVVARSPYRVPVGADGKCGATVAGAVNAPGWQLAQADGALASSGISLAHLPNWKCYRYRVYETVVPLRNVVWGAP